MTTAVQTVPGAKARFFYGWIILFACFNVTTMASGTMMAFGVFINPLADAMGWSHSALSFTYALSAIVSGIGVLFVGSYLNTYSLRQIFMWSALVHGFGIYMASTAQTIEAFYLWYGFVAALGRSAFFISTTTLITRWFETRRGLVMGIMMAGNGVGPFFFSPLVTWLIYMWDWQTAFVVLSLTLAIAMMLSCLLIRNHPHDMGLLPYGRSPAPARPVQPTPRGPAGPPPARPTTGSLWGEVLRLEGFWSISAINFFCCVCHSIPLVHIVGFAQHAGLSAFASAWVLSLMSVSSIVGRIYWGIFADRHGSSFALVITLFMQGALVLWLVNTQDPVVFIVYALVWGFGYGGVGTQYGVVSREVFGARLFGPAYAGQNCFAMVGMAIGGFLGGYLFDISHDYTASWLVSFAAGLISSLIAMDLLAQRDRAQNAQVQTLQASAQPAAPVPSTTVSV
jgi:MFS family permease